MTHRRRTFAIPTVVISTFAIPTLAITALVLTLLACTAAPDAGPDPESGSDAGSDAAATPVAQWQPFIVATFNTGTTAGMGHDQPPEDGYSQAMADRSDAHYGDGLAWTTAVTAARAWFTAQVTAGAAIDIVGFQEIFWAGACPAIPVSAHAGFYCEGWQPGDPTVITAVLGPDYQVACHPGKDDKCIAVRKAFGSIDGCDADFCKEAGVGVEVPGCGKGSRVVRFGIQRHDGGKITVVHVHGSSGLSADDRACRVKQFGGIFTKMSDGAPGINGAVNLVLGDFNTDPHRFAAIDPSAQLLLDHAGVTPQAAIAQSKPLHFITAIGDDATPTYGGVVNIDHILSDKLTGTCWSADGSAGHAAVVDARYFDHVPTVCAVRPR